ncbi:serine hydrolase [Myxococcus sp. K38C18041901]|uniref:serine hydrolase domain-containing protein n=1 Tax=Myxococcus guangdongensis TaxID=2906760 RepID=UPI0020A72C8F|nr:serine hydrolase domain-containing protein [Myxococcus guangdongensis]MCP3063824.1 serine hydrolase [Myxococcus guangdongensis]
MRPSHSLLLWVALVSWGLVVPVARAQPVRETRAQRHARLDALFATWRGKSSPGCGVGVWRDGTRDYVRGHGMANLEFGVPLTPRSSFNLASISKQFIAFSIGLLAQEGKLSLDDDVREHVPELSAHDTPITVAHLMHHLNGLREQGPLLSLAGWRTEDLYTEEDVLWVLSRQRGVNFAVGEEVLYGNAAYALLGVIVRRVSGTSLRVFADERIFKPLGMADTSFRDDQEPPLSQRATGYLPRAEGGWRLSSADLGYKGTSAVYSTVSDMLKWQQNLLDGRVGGTALRDLLQTSGRLNDGRETGYGGGLRLGAYRGLRTVSHDGFVSGFRTESILFPEQKLAITVLCNGGNIDPTVLARKVAGVYLGNLLKDTTPPAVVLPAEELAVLAGNYWSPQTDEVVRLEVKEGALREVGASAALIPIGPGLFRPAEPTPGVWRFNASAAPGAPALGIQDFWPTTREFIRVREPLPTSSELEALVGKYRGDEVDMTYTVRLVDGKLALSWFRRDDLVLEPVGGNRFVSSFGAVSFTKGASGGVEAMLVSSRRLRRFRAERLPSVASTAPLTQGKP